MSKATVIAAGKFAGNLNRALPRPARGAAAHSPAQALQMARQFNLRLNQNRVGWRSLVRKD
jgi:hypothetical protein